MKKQPGIYILRSLKNSSYYIGSTIDIENRLIEHNSGKTKATKYLTPWELKLFFPTQSIKEARQLEYKLKKLKSKKIIEKIILTKEITIK
jgi:putative endonuclease